MLASNLDGKSVAPPKNFSISLNSCFKVPGSITNGINDELNLELASLNEIDGVDCLTLSSPGELYINTNLGPLKILVVGNEISRCGWMQVASFLAKNIIHSHADRWLCYPDGLHDRFYWKLLAKKLFYSDQPLMLHCSEAADFAAFVFHYIGVKVRKSWVYNLQSRSGHTLMEVYDDLLKKWVMLDIDYGVYLTDSDEIPLSTNEIRRKIDEDVDLLTIRPLASKYWLRDEFNLTEHSRSSMSWNAGMNSARLTSDPEKYKIMLKKCFQGINLYEYSFDEVTMTSAVKKIVSL